MSDFLAVAFGGGRNGAMLLGMAERGIKPDVITFANTGRPDRTEGEKALTYENVDRMSAWCMREFGVPITEVHKRSMYASLYDQSMRTGTLPSAAYGLRSCSDKWKIQPQDRFMNNYAPALSVWRECELCGRAKQEHRRVRVQMTEQEARAEASRLEEKYEKFMKKTEISLAAVRAFRLAQAIRDWQVIPKKTVFYCGDSDIQFLGRKITKAIGYDAGEQRRAKIAESDKYRYRYLLIEWNWFLEDCIAAYKRHNLPVPVKSACYYCPSSTKEEVIKLHDESPDLYWSAVAMEDKALASGALRNIKGLGRHWSWRDLITIQPAERAALVEAPQMACACFDSEDE